MLIRTQDKSFLIMPENYKAIIARENGDVVATNTIDGDDHIFSIFRNNGFTDSVILGHYSTRTKALKVLDMIQNDYMLLKCRSLLDVKSDIPCPNPIFQMPLDNEIDQGTPIEVLGLNSRSINALSNKNIKTVEELEEIVKRQGEFINIRGIGEESRKEIKRALKKYHESKLTEVEP